MILRTPRLLLRRAETGDAAALHAIFSDPEAMRYWSRLPHERIEQTEAWLAGMIAAPLEISDDFIVVRDGEVIGKIGCWRVPEVGFILDRRYWGQGLAREALEAVIAHLFGRPDIARITADVDPRNAASLRLLEGLGFVETHRASRTWRLGDEWCDSVYLALERDA